MVPVSVPRIDPPLSYLAPVKTHSSVLTAVYYDSVFFLLLLFLYFLLPGAKRGLLAGGICRNAGETSVFIKR